jgi:hypothetical protein
MHVSMTLGEIPKEKFPLERGKFPLKVETQSKTKKSKLLNWHKAINQHGIIPVAGP